LLFEFGPELSEFKPDPPMSPWGINFGAGTNSWAMALAAHARGLRPNWCLFADTGSELPETYVSVRRFSEWAARNGWPFEVVRWYREDGRFESIHANCLRTGYLPSKAYGLAGCTMKWKVHPMDKWRKQNGFSKTAVAIGYDNGEEHRKKSAARRACEYPESDHDQVFWYPLIAWGMDRKDCHKLCVDNGITVGKSSCFMCPNMKTEEWDWLEKNHPELYGIAEVIERQAKEQGKANSSSIFRSSPRQIECSCFIETMPEGSWIDEIINDNGRTANE